VCELRCVRATCFRTMNETLEVMHEHMKSVALDLIHCLVLVGTQCGTSIANFRAHIVAVYLGDSYIDGLELDYCLRLLRY
jgi:hypothetical protein